MQTTTQAGPETHATAWGEAMPRHTLQTRSIMRCHSSDNARFLGCQMEGVLDGCFRVMGGSDISFVFFQNPPQKRPLLFTSIAPATCRFTLSPTLRAAKARAAIPNHARTSRDWAGTSKIARTHRNKPTDVRACACVRLSRVAQPR